MFSGVRTVMELNQRRIQYIREKKYKPSEINSEYNRVKAELIKAGNTISYNRITVYRPNTAQNYMYSVFNLLPQDGGKDNTITFAKEGFYI